MNRRRVLAIALGVMVTFGVGGATVGVGATTVSDTHAESVDVTDVQDGAQNETNQTAETIPITEAIAAAENRTQNPNATVVGAELGQSGGGLLDFGDDAESVYTVDVLLPNGTHIEVAVNATNGSVVQTEEQQEGFLGDIFGEDRVPEKPLNLSALFNASEAVELAQNETDANGTVTAVNLGQRNQTLVYQVQIRQTGGEQMTVVVDAMKGGQGVITVEGAGNGGDDGGNSTGGGGNGGNSTGSGG